MQAALEILLKAPCYHAFDLYDHLEQIPLWNAALDGKFPPSSGTTTTASAKAEPFTTAAHFDTILWPYAAVTDVPAICFASELVTAYPAAKVVLVKRDTEAWYASFDDNVIKHLYDPAMHIVARLDRWFLGPIAGVHFHWAEAWMGVGREQGLRRGREEMRARARGLYESHYEHVKSVTPEGRLLEYELGTGWEPLCEFLGIENVPDVPFPRVNESAAMDVKMRQFLRNGVKSALWHFGVFAAPVFVGVAAWWFLARP